MIRTALLLLALLPSSAAADSAGVVPDLLYAEVGGISLRLDLHLPEGEIRPPLIVWIHGGAWRSGSRKGMPLGTLVADGYAVATIDYRLSPQAKFPAQIHDIKDAIRFLRARGGQWDLSTEKTVIAGASAGGHLAALAGVSNGNAELEGTVGEHPDQPSDIDGIISFFGASNLTTILSQSTPHGLGVRVPALELFLGDRPENIPAIAKLASPVFHVDKNDPPLLLLHGDQDPQMPINQAHELEGAYKKVGCEVQFETVHGAAHGGSMFYDAKRMVIIKMFLDRFH